IIMGLVALAQAVRRIQLNYAKRIVGTNAAKEIGGNRNFIPLKVNSAGVMPIIFAQALMFIPPTLAGFVSGTEEGAAPTGFLASLSDPAALWYNVIFAFLVIAFTYFYTALTFNPTEIADN